MAAAERRRPIPIRSTLDIRGVPKIARRETDAHPSRAPASPSNEGSARPAEWKAGMRTDGTSITRTSDLHAKEELSTPVVGDEGSAGKTRQTYADSRTRPFDAQRISGSKQKKSWSPSGVEVDTYGPASRWQFDQTIYSERRPR